MTVALAAAALAARTASSFQIAAGRRGAAAVLSSSSSASRAVLRPSLSSSRVVASRLMSAAAADTDTETPALVHGRVSRGALASPDARTVTDNLPLILSHLRSRRASDETVSAAERIASLNDDRVSLIQARDRALSVRKEQSAAVGKLMRDGGEEKHGEALAEAKRLSGEAADEAASVEEKLAEIEETVGGLLASIPNLLDDRVPDGNDDGENEEVDRWGDPSDLPRELGWPDDFEAKWHDDVASGLDGWKAENAVAMSGARFVALSGPAAKLERALSSYMLDQHSNVNGYTEASVPYVVGRTALEGTSQLPKFEDDLFRIAKESHTCNGEDAFLIPTAEVPLTNLHAGQILEESDLPLSYVALTPCFRAEAGSYGRDTRGLIRTHQFHKVELVKISSADASDDEHELLTGHAEGILKDLKLPYRKVRLCSGDIGFSARHCYDLEVYLPSTGEYREISSCSNTGDFQARRMALRYRPAEKAEEAGDKAEAPKGKGGKKKKKAKKPKPQLCHTINGSGLAVGRTLLAVLENYQMPDGSVVVPEVLRPYLGGLEVLKKA
eukprot:CAMPEP_0113541928 /NCGR_PEP_ID=MMETSP0015_2-20120614/9317_1 /TAXON_ID=2838 /ORGANISM="Odontella" /LENGTH=556 /DNA_ID=CAMNT_0000441915 /DNA_START=227 /DNA_END=1897 /DNA_ORIENTATION=- /assembly_acc=CAM_ASM_000160